MKSITTKMIKSFFFLLLVVKFFSKENNEVESEQKDEAWLMLVFGECISMALLLYFMVDCPTKKEVSRIDKLYLKIRYIF